MVEEENQNNLNKIRSTKHKININYTGSTHFENEELEKNYLIDSSKKDNYQDMLANFLIILGYVCYGIYLYIVFYRDILMLINLMCLSLSLIIYFSHKLTNSKISKYYIDQILILISYLNTLVKIYYVLVKTDDNKDEHCTEILRCLFYSFLSTYLYILMKIENCFNTYIFYMSSHFLVAFLSESYSKKEHFYHVEWAFGTMLGFIFLYLRKIWEVTKRNAYSEKSKFDTLFNFAKDLLRNANKSQFNSENSKILYETQIN